MNTAVEFVDECANRLEHCAELRNRGTYGDHIMHCAELGREYNRLLCDISNVVPYRTVQPIVFPSWETVELCGLVEIVMHVTPEYRTVC